MKPIDWTRALRTTGPEHHTVHVVSIEPRQRLPMVVRVDGTGQSFVLTRDGRMADVEGVKPYVENVPCPGSRP
jgi:hypothetical protein